MTKIRKAMLVAPLLLATSILPVNAQNRNYRANQNNSQFYNGIRQGGRGGDYNDPHYQNDPRYQSDRNHNDRNENNRNENYNNDRNRNQGGIGPGKGALIGGGGGAVLGALFGGGLKGALVGGAAGAGIGAIAGQVNQNNKRNNNNDYNNGHR